MMNKMKKQKIALERYDDLCVFFDNDEKIINEVLNDKEGFKKWLERVLWHITTCDSMFNKITDLNGKFQELFGEYFNKDMQQ